MGSDQLVGALTDEQTDTVILTSSAKEDEGDRYLELLDSRRTAGPPLPTSRRPKPQPDLLRAALERPAGPRAKR